MIIKAKFAILANSKMAYPVNALVFDAISYRVVGFALIFFSTFA